MAILKAKPAEPIASLEQAEIELRELCTVLADIQIKEGQAEKRVLKVQAQADTIIKPLIDREAELTQRLTHFIEEHQGLIAKGAKSIKLSSGELGMRKLQGKLKPIGKDKKAMDAAAARAAQLLLKEAPHCVKTAINIDLNKLRAEGQETWERVGFGLVGAKEEPYVKPAAKVVKELTGQLSAGK